MNKLIKLPTSKFNVYRVCGVQTLNSKTGWCLWCCVAVSHTQILLEVCGKTIWCLCC